MRISISIYSLNLLQRICLFNRNLVINLFSFFKFINSFKIFNLFINFIIIVLILKSFTTISRTYNKSSFHALSMSWTYSLRILINFIKLFNSIFSLFYFIRIIFISIFFFLFFIFITSLIL